MIPAAFRPEQPADLPADYRKILALIVGDGPMTERTVIELSGVSGVNNKLFHMTEVGLVHTVQIAGSRHIGYRASHKGRRWHAALTIAVGVAPARTRPFDGIYVPPAAAAPRAGSGRAFSIPSVGLAC